MSANWKITIAYDGTDFHGWQVQPGLATIQGLLAETIERVLGESVLPQGSGRTDTGVHALAQVASCSLAAPIPAENLQRALNRTLPSAIRVLKAETVPPEFHARHSAQSKWYEYRIFRGEICPPWLARYAYALNLPQEMDALHAAAEVFLGEHDFSSFAASDPDAGERAAEIIPQDEDANGGREGNIREIYASSWSEQEDLLVYRVHGNGFLHHMVRNLVGTMLDAGRGQICAGDLPGILAARERSAAGPTVPARGLFLMRVIY